jgi:hypothetical protein
VVLYERGTWALTIREEHRFGVLGNMAMRRKLGPKGDEVTGS